jgi:hypothetical protein
MENENDYLIRSRRIQENNYFKYLYSTVFFYFTCLWYLITDRDKYTVCVGNRKLDHYELKLYKLEDINFKELEKKYKSVEQLEEDLKQNTCEFQSRLRNLVQKFKSKAKQRGLSENFTKDDIDKMMTTYELKLKYYCMSLKSTVALEKNYIHHLQKIYNEVSDCRRKIDQWRIQLSTKEHLNKMSIVLKGIDGEKLSELGDACYNGIADFLTELAVLNEDIKPPDAEKPVVSKIQTSELEQEFWSDVLVNAKIVNNTQSYQEEVLTAA